MEPDLPAEILGEEAPSTPVPQGAPFLLCPRCGKQVRAGMMECPWCEADRWRQHHEQRHVLHAEDHRTFSRILWAFGLMLLTNVILCLSMPLAPSDRPITEDQCRTYLTALSIGEGVDTVVVLITVLGLSQYLRLPEEAGHSPRAAWILALPLLGGLLAANFGYHHLLLWLSGSEPMHDRVAESGFFPAWQLAVNCIQPAVVEEFFFRGLVFGWLSKAVGPGSAAFASASMFAAAHTGGLGSFPVLFLIGAGLAWMRWKTRGFAIPMLLHFLHNLIVGLV
jgi:membrane protease YdiL (CAAX protease family)